MTAPSRQSLADASSMDVLGVPVSIVNMQSAVRQLVGWARQPQARTVIVRDVHGIMRAQQDAELMRVHREADLVVPDGQPLTWIGRWRGYGVRISRTPGADLVEAVCRDSVGEGLTHFFYGGKPGVAEEMAATLQRRFPGIRVVGCCSPRFRAIDAASPLDEFDSADIARIQAANPDFIWVGLSTPKQEFWMNKCAPAIGRGVLLGVGAAFDFHAGKVKRAPRWLRDYGFEWLYRFLSEPGRLWRRYLVHAPTFVVLVLHQLATEDAPRR